MKYDSAQITKTENGYLVSCMTKVNHFTKTPPEQKDYVFKAFEEVVAHLIGDKK